MPQDFKIDLTTNDLVIPLEIVSGVDEFKQRVQITLNTFLNEWFANPDLGVNYYGTVLKRTPELNKLKQDILNVLSGFDEILLVNNLRITKRTYDEYDLFMDIYSIYGQLIFNLEVGNK